MKIVCMGGVLDFEWLIDKLNVSKLPLCKSFDYLEKIQYDIKNKHEYNSLKLTSLDHQAFHKSEVFVLTTPTSVFPFDQIKCFASSRTVLDEILFEDRFDG